MRSRTRNPGLGANEFVREQLGRIQRALKSLEEDFKAGNPARFRLYAEAYEDLIAELEGQLREYEQAVAKGT